MPLNKKLINAMKKLTTTPNTLSIKRYSELRKKICRYLGINEGSSTAELKTKLEEVAVSTQWSTGLARNETQALQGISTNLANGAWPQHDQKTLLISEARDLLKVLQEPMEQAKYKRHREYLCERLAKIEKLGGNPAATAAVIGQSRWVLYKALSDASIPCDLNTLRHDKPRMLVSAMQDATTPSEFLKQRELLCVQLDLHKHCSTADLDARIETLEKTDTAEALPPLPVGARGNESDPEWKQRSQWRNDFTKLDTAYKNNVTQALITNLKKAKDALEAADDPNQSTLKNTVTQATNNLNSAIGRAQKVLSTEQLTNASRHIISAVHPYAVADQTPEMRIDVPQHELSEKIGTYQNSAIRWQVTQQLLEELKESSGEKYLKKRQELCSLLGMQDKNSNMIEVIEHLREQKLDPDAKDALTPHQNKAIKTCLDITEQHHTEEINEKELKKFQDKLANLQGNIKTIKTTIKALENKAQDARSKLTYTKDQTEREALTTEIKDLTNQINPLKTELRTLEHKKAKADKLLKTYGLLAVIVCAGPLAGLAAVALYALWKIGSFAVTKLANYLSEPGKLHAQAEASSPEGIKRHTPEEIHKLFHSGKPTTTEGIIMSQAFSLKQPALAAHAATKLAPAQQRAAVETILGWEAPTGTLEAAEKELVTAKKDAARTNKITTKGGHVIPDKTSNKQMSANKKVQEQLEKKIAKLEIAPDMLKLQKAYYQEFEPKFKLRGWEETKEVGEEWKASNKDNLNLRELEPQEDKAAEQLQNQADNKDLPPAYAQKSQLASKSMQQPKPQITPTPDPASTVNTSPAT